MHLTQLGWNPFFESHFQSFSPQGYVPARVICGYKQLYTVSSDAGELLAEVSGKFRHQSTSSSDFPVVGDWIIIQPFPQEHKAIIHAVLPRKSKVSRKTAGVLTEEQVIAANIDTICIVAALEGYRGVNARRLERYLTQVYNTGASPVIVLNKADTCLDVEEQLVDVEAIAYGVPVHAISAKEGLGLEALQAYFTTGKTAALIGTSGVGKSTLINCLIGEERQRVHTISDDTGKGLHTTTHRELIVLPSGGMIIDNPGMRELQLWGDEENVKGTFEDIEELAARCRFADCQHQSEPGCAVKAALEEGELDRKRYKNYVKLKKELVFLEKRQEQSLRLAEKARGKQLEKWIRQHQKTSFKTYR